MRSWVWGILVTFLVGALVLTAACAPGATPTPAAKATSTPAPTAAPAPAPKATPAPTAAPAPTARPAGPGKPAWEVEWERAIEAGKNEGKVVIYANLVKDVTTALRETFKKEYGIEVEFVTGRSSELAEKVLTERRAGLYLEDAFMGGLSTTLNILKPGGALTPLRPLLIRPDVNDPKLWWQKDRLPFSDKAGMVLGFRASPETPFTINTSQVKEEELKSWKDVLNPRWKGKIVMNDPTATGDGNNIFWVMSEYIYGPDFWREFVKQEPVTTRDQRLPIEWVARSKYLLAIGAKQDVMVEFQKAGVPLKMIMPVEGTFVTTGASTISIIDRAPHPNAIKVFANWLLSKEPQTIISKIMLVQSAREDVPTDFLNPLEVRQPGVKYFEALSEESIVTRAKSDKLVKDIFAPVMK